MTDRFFTKPIEEVTDSLIDYRGKTPPKTDSGIRLITAKVVKDGFIVNGDHEYISEETYEEWMTRGFPQNGDALITTEAPLGEVAQLKTSDKIALAQRIILLRGNPEIIDQDYYVFALQSPFVQAQLEARATGTTVRGIKQSELRQVEIPLYPLPIQRKIAAVLSAYDDLIENNTRRIAILEEMAQAIYREWFVHFRFPGHEEVDFVDSEVEEVPAGWEVRRLSELVDTQYGYTESATDEADGPKFVRGTDINKTSYINWDTVPYCPIDPDDYSKFKLYVGDIVVVRMADPGKAGLIEDEVDAVFASYLIRFKIATDNLLPYYLYYFLMSDRYTNWATGASTGTTRKSASAKVLTNIDIVLPPITLQERFQHQVSTLRSLLTVLLRKNSILRKTRDLLLPRLVSGELDISDVEVVLEAEI